MMVSRDIPRLARLARIHLCAAELEELHASWGEWTVEARKMGVAAPGCEVAEMIQPQTGPAVSHADAPIVCESATALVPVGEKAGQWWSLDRNAEGGPHD